MRYLAAAQGYMRTAVVLAAALAFSAGEITAQRRPALDAPPPRSGPRPPTQSQLSAEGAGPLVVAGTLGAVIGFAGGAVLGYRVERHYFPCLCDDPGLGGLIVGSAIGSAAAVPVAVHLANGRRGSFPRVLGAATAVGAAGLFGLIATASSEAGLPFLLGTPAVQIIVSTIVEQSTSRNAEER